MKKYITRIINLIKFAWNYLVYQSKRRKAERLQSEVLQAIDPEKISSRMKQKLKANKEKIRSGQPSSYSGMIRGARKKRLNARSKGSKLYLGKRNKFGLRDILNGQKDAADRCELIIDPSNVKRLNVSSIINSLKPATA